MITCGVEDWGAKFGNRYRKNYPRYIQYFCEEIQSVQLDTARSRIFTGTGTNYANGVRPEGQVIVWDLMGNVNNKRMRGDHYIIDTGKPKWIRNSLKFVESSNDYGLLIVGGTFPTVEFPPIQLWKIPPDLEFSSTGGKNIRTRNEDKETIIQQNKDGEDEKGEEENVDEENEGGGGEHAKKLATLGEEYFGCVSLDRNLNIIIAQKRKQNNNSQVEDNSATDVAKEKEHTEDKTNNEQSPKPQKRYSPGEDIAILDLETQKEVSLLKHHTDIVRDLIVHGPSHTVASISGDSTIAIWDLRDPVSPVSTILLHSSQKNWGLRISSPSVKSNRPTGFLNTLVSLSVQPYPQPTVLQCWDLRAGLPGRNGANNKVLAEEKYQKFISNGCAMSVDDSKLLVGAVSGFVMAYDLVTGAEYPGRHFDTYGLYCVDHDQDWMACGFANPGAGGLGNSLAVVDISVGSTSGGSCLAM